MSLRFGAQNLVHDYGSRRALDDVSFEISSGETLGILGPNGAGKTTLFHILIGLLRPTSGSLLLNGHTHDGRDAALRQQTGVVFQDASLDGKLTVRENLMLFGAIHGLPAAEAAPRMAELIALVELTDRLDDTVEKLSGGLKRRAELVRALLPRPKVLILDEPTSGVDLAAFRRFWNWLDVMRQKDGLCILLTTHRADEAERCTRVLILDEGKVITQGTPQTLVQSVGGDIIRIRAAEPAALATQLTARLSLDARVEGDDVVITADAGHTLIPRVVDAASGIVLQSLVLQRPGIAEAFLKLTGRSLVDGTRVKAA